MRFARMLLVLCMFTSLGVTGYGVVWGLNLLGEASGYQKRTGEGVMYIWLFFPALVVLAGLLLVSVFALILAFTAQREIDELAGEDVHRAGVPAGRHR